MDNLTYEIPYNKTKGVGVIVAGLVVLLLASAAYLIIPNMLRPTVSVQLGDGLFRAQVIRNGDQVINLAAYEKKPNGTDKEVLGASNGSTLSNEAILIIFPKVSIWSVSLKDIQESVDVVWLNEEKQVSFIAKNVSPDNLGMENVEPKSESKYVIKLESGVVDDKVIKIGTQASFDLKED